MKKLSKILTRLRRGQLQMGCTVEASLSVSGEYLVRTERTFQRGRLATESLVVEKLLRP